MSENLPVLSRRVLVFNKSWQIVNTTTVKDAIILVCRERAVGLCLKTFQSYSLEEWLSSENPPATEHFIQGVGGKIPAPEAIILVEYDDVYHQTVAYTVENVYRRDVYECQYCGEKVTDENISLDHIIPRSRGGASTFINVVVCCFRCNNFKADRLPHEANMRLIRKPVVPKWNPIRDTKPDHRPKSWQHFVKKEWYEN